MILNLILVVLSCLMTAFFIGLKNKKSVKSDKNETKNDAKEPEKEFYKKQDRIKKEYINFMSYNGEIQDDID